MRRGLIRAAAFACAAAFAAGDAVAEEAAAEGGAIPVEVRETAEGFELLRGGEPFFVRGVGGDRRLELLARIGGNSYRTWGKEQLEETRVGADGVERPVLDHAHRLGLTVCAGFWMEHPRHGFDYGDRAAVEAQLGRLRAFVERHKDHPAILVWGIGNEVELGGADHEVVFRAINEAARMVKEIDPHHPTMAVIAEIGEEKAEAFARLCPDVDILGVNSYGGLGDLAARMEAQGLARPYLVTEYGPLGHWEIGRTPWGGRYEQTSTEKARFLERNYRTSIAGSAKCLGGYAFLWGNKQETTATWYGMLLADGTPVQAVETLARLWGRAPENRAPRIEGVINAGFDHSNVRAGEMLRASVEVDDPDGDDLRYRWVVRPVSTDRKIGGDREAAPPDLEGLVKESSSDGSVTFEAPGEPGGYRLFVYIEDGVWAATANLPFRVVE